VARAIAKNRAARKPTAYGEPENPPNAHVYPQAAGLRTSSPTGAVRHRPRSDPNAPYFRRLYGACGHRRAACPPSSRDAGRGIHRLNSGFSRPLIRAAMTPRTRASRRQGRVFHANLIKHDENALVVVAVLSDEARRDARIDREEIRPDAGAAEESTASRRAGAKYQACWSCRWTSRGERHAQAADHVAPPIPIVMRRIFHPSGPARRRLDRRALRRHRRESSANRISRLATGQRIALEVRAPARKASRAPRRKAGPTEAA